MLEKIKILTGKRKIFWKKHALKRMLERNIEREQVFEALSDCIIIEEHKIARPLQTVLVLGYHKARPLHIVVGVDNAQELLWIITVYRPNRFEWDNAYMNRRRP